MYKIETNTWNEYKIEELFDIHPTNHYNMTNNNLFMKEGSIPVIVNSSYNNGVGGYVSLLPTEKGGIITFSDTTDANSIFYQPNDFIGYSHVQGMYPKFKNVTNNIMRFIATIFKIKALTMGYDYANKFRRDIAEKLKIKLPSKNGEPDWEYMESYMKYIMEKSQQNISKLKSIDTNKNKIDINNWKKFHLYDKDLFIIDMGTKLDKSKMTVDNPSVNFVGRANTNNGITLSVDKIFGLKPYQAGNMTLSLGGEYLGSCFVQPKEFYTSQNVVVLIPQWDMPNEVKNFISTMIFKESRTHYKAFVDELNRHIKTDFSFYLPVDLNNKPDWEYMKNYMKNIMQDTQSKLDKLVCC